MKQTTFRAKDQIKIVRLAEHLEAGLGEFFTEAGAGQGKQLG
jgi:hypothetical protein